MSKKKERKTPRTFMCEFCFKQKADHLSMDGNWDRYKKPGSYEWRFICADCDLPGTNYEYAIAIDRLIGKEVQLNWLEHLRGKIWFSAGAEDSFLHHLGLLFDRDFSEWKR